MPAIDRHVIPLGLGDASRGFGWWLWFRGYLVIFVNSCRTTLAQLHICIAYIAVTFEWLETCAKSLVNRCLGGRVVPSLFDKASFLGATRSVSLRDSGWL